MSEGGSRGLSTWEVLLRIAFVGISAIGYGGLFGMLVILTPAGPLGGAAAGIFVTLALIAAGIVARGRHFRVAFEVLVLVLLVAWGLVLNHSFPAACTRSACDDDFRRFFSEPHVWGLLALHVATVVAYAVSRRRPEALRPAVEALVAAMLVVGVVLHVLVAIQFGSAVVIGVALAPIAMPALAPSFTVALYATEVVTRLRRRGLEARGAQRSEPSLLSGARGAEPPEREAPPATFAWGIFGRALAASPMLLGLYALVMGALFRHPAAGIHALTQTCDHVFSTIPLVVTKGDCHYLCTVAARGHAALVGPERLGRRGGHVIVVNRQLAIANAFEDLLHARWPRFGALARSLYDRLGLPVSRLIRSPWAADAVYLAMKPAEWCFYLALLLLDRDAPEARIDRMYR